MVKLKLKALGKVFLSQYAQVVALSFSTPANISLQAKGYADLATRRFIRAVLDAPCFWFTKKPKVFGLFDYDPDGIAQIDVFRHGTPNHPLEATLPEMEWIGLKMSQIKAKTKGTQPVQQISEYQIAKARSLLRRWRVVEDSIQAQYRDALKEMLKTKEVAQIQALDELEGGIFQQLRAAMYWNMLENGDVASETVESVSGN